MLRFRFRNHPTDDYADRLAAWQISHAANRHDLTAEQDRRRRETNAMLNAGLDANRVSAVRWAVDHGRIEGADDA